MASRSGCATASDRLRLSPARAATERPFFHARAPLGPSFARGGSEVASEVKSRGTFRDLFHPRMLAFIIRRFLQAIVVMLSVAFISFMLFQYVGDPVTNLLGQEATPAQRAQLRADL